jgi:hypothetical protein
VQERYLRPQGVVPAVKQYIEAVDGNGSCAIAYFLLGASLEEGGVLELADGRTMDRLQFFAEAIKRDGSNALFCFSRACEVTKPNAVVWVNGTAMSRAAQLIEAIKQDINFADAFYALGVIVGAQAAELFGEGRRGRAAGCWADVDASTTLRRGHQVRR